MKHIKEEPIHSCCFDCGKKYGKVGDGAVTAQNNKFCNICGELGTITNVRNFNYLRGSEFEERCNII